MSPHRDPLGAQIEIARRRLAALRREREEVEQRYRSACTSLETISSELRHAPLSKAVAAQERPFSFRSVVEHAFFVALVADILMALFML